MNIDRQLLVETLVLIYRLERIGQALDALVDRGSSNHVPASWLTLETKRVRMALEDAIGDAPSA